MFTKYGTSLIPEHLPSQWHVHEEGTQPAQQILVLPTDNAAVRPSNAEPAKAEESESVRHTDFVTQTLLNCIHPNKTPALGSLMAVLDLQWQPQDLV